MQIIDAHTHVLPEVADLAIEVMDRCGIERAVALAWHDGFGEGLARYVQAFAPYGDRFIVFGNVDWRRVNEPDFGEMAAAQIADGVARGMRGLKVYKALGLEYRQPDGSLWPVNSPAFDPIWAEAGRQGIPVLIHTADPVAFWQPVNDANFWNGVLYGEYAWWSYYRKGLPSREALLAERNDVIGRHPQTTFICPHVGSKADCLDSAADDLDAFPNLFYDLSARIPIMGCSPRRAAHSRAFLTACADRVLFGTDVIYDAASVATGVQAQCLYQPGALPLDGADPRERYVATTVAFVQSHLAFLATETVQEDPPFRRSRSGFRLYGLGLEADVVARIVGGGGAAGSRVADRGAEKGCESVPSCELSSSRSGYAGSVLYRLYLEPIEELCCHSAHSRWIRPSFSSKGLLAKLPDAGETPDRFAYAPCCLLLFDQDRIGGVVNLGIIVEAVVCQKALHSTSPSRCHRPGALYNRMLVVRCQQVADCLQLW